MNDSSIPPLPSVFDNGDEYDSLLGGKEFTYGLDYYVGLARETNGPVLDIACGTGRILLPCLQAGVDIEGLDLFEPMLDTLRAKARLLDLSPQLHVADMSDFSLSRRFGLVMIPFNAFIHNMTQDAQIRCLKLCRQHLLPGGRLTFDTFFPSLQIVGTPENTRVLEGEIPHPVTGQLMRLFDTRSFDRVEQIQHSICEVEVSDKDGVVDILHRSQVSSRYVYKQEMELLLRVAGFARWEICGDFNHRPLTRESDAMVVSAWNTMDDPRFQPLEMEGPAIT